MRDRQTPAAIGSVSDTLDKLRRYEIVLRIPRESWGRSAYSPRHDTSIHNLSQMGRRKDPIQLRAWVDVDFFSRACQNKKHVLHFGYLVVC